MAKVISFGQQKGGVGKTTTCAMTAYLLSQTHKVLVIDFDSQGSITTLLTQRNIYDFAGRTILQAVIEQNIKKYIVQLTENLSIVPAEDELVTMARHIYDERGGANAGMLLDQTLAPIKGSYDYILIDQPPALDELTINALAASDYAVVILLSEQLCLTALERYFSALKGVQNKYNPLLRVAGILVAISDSRTLSDQIVVQKVRRDFGHTVFKSEIRRKSRIKEYPIIGIQSSTKADREAQAPYVAFVKELIERVG